MVSEFAKEKVFWTRKMNLNLVKFIESKPNIWNPKHPKYSTIEYRDKTYAQFAAKYGNKFTGQAVKDRWTNIRSTFAHYLRKLRQSRARGNAEVFKINWLLWEPCKFLLKIDKKMLIKVDHTTSNFENNTTKAREDVTDEEFSDQADSNEDISCQNVANGILSVFKGVQNDIFGIENNIHTQIGQKVTEKLSEMSSYDAAQLINKITSILLLYHKDNPLNPNYFKLEKM